MSNFQQLNFSVIGDGISSDDFVVCVHRRTATILCYSRKNFAYFMIKAEAGSINKWNLVGRWVPEQLSEVVAVLPIEAYDAFMFLVVHLDVPKIFLVNLGGVVILDYMIEKLMRPICVEIDQNRRELIIGFENGNFFCYFFHLLKTNEAKLNGFLSLTLRKCFLLDPSFCQIPVQIASVDLLGYFLVLTLEGNVICLDSSRFDVLFILEAEVFVIPPVKLWVDKFGPSFALMNLNPYTGAEQIEFWTPPKEYATCEAGQFSRVNIPIPGQLVDLCIETVGVDQAATFLVTLTKDCKVQLWKPSEEGSLVFETKINLTVPHDLAFVQNKLPGQVNEIQDMVFPGLNRQFGYIGFSKKDPYFPDSFVTVTITLFNSVYRLAVHLRHQIDLAYHQTYIDMAIAQLQLEQNQAYEALAPSSPIGPMRFLKDSLNYALDAQKHKLEREKSVMEEQSLSRRTSHYSQPDQDDDKSQLSEGSIHSIRFLLPDEQHEKEEEVEGEKEKEGVDLENNEVENVNEELDLEENEGVGFEEENKVEQENEGIDSEEEIDVKLEEVGMEVEENEVELENEGVDLEENEEENEVHVMKSESEGDQDTQGPLGLQTMTMTISTMNDSLVETKAGDPEVEQKTSFDLEDNSELQPQEVLEVSKVLRSSSNDSGSVHSHRSFSIVIPPVEEQKEKLSESPSDEGPSSPPPSLPLSAPNSPILLGSPLLLPNLFSEGPPTTGPTYDPPQKLQVDTSHNNLQTFKSDISSLIGRGVRGPSERMPEAFSPGNSLTRGAVQVNPKTYFFVPSHVLSRRDTAVGRHQGSTPDDLLRVTFPYGMLIQSKVVVPEEEVVVDTIEDVIPKNTLRKTRGGRKGPHEKVVSQLITRVGLKNVEEIQLEQPFVDLNILHFAFAYRSGLFSVMNELKENFVYRLDSTSKNIKSSAPPVRVEFNLRNKLQVTRMLHCDIQILCVESHVVEEKKPKPKPFSRKPPKAKKPVDDASSLMITNTLDTQVNKSDPSSETALNETGKNKGVKPKKEELGVHSLVVVGDSKGDVHIAVVAPDQVLSYSSFKAHNTPIVELIVCGDSIRPLWRIGAVKEMDVSKSIHYVPVTRPGSALITLSKEGEVKTWQPVFVPRVLPPLAPFEKLFVTYVVEWRLSGIFALNNVPRDTVKPVDNHRFYLHKTQSLTTGSFYSSVQDATKRKARHLQHACLDLTTMNILISFKSGEIEQWPIPGLLDAGPGKLSTSQTYNWRNVAMHLESVTDIVVWSNVPRLSTMREVDFSGENHRREEVLRSLATFVRWEDQHGKGKTPDHSRFTIGYTHAELKELVDYSTMVTSSKDCSIMLWSFHFTEAYTELTSSILLVPHPCRRFKFSTPPTRGLCYSTTPYGSVAAREVVWKVSSIVGGVVVTACEAPREKLFVQDEFIERETVGLVPQWEAAGREADVGNGTLHPIHKQQTIQFNDFMMNFDDPDYEEDSLSSVGLEKDYSTKKMPLKKQKTNVKGLSLFPIPAIGSILKPSALVNAANVQRELVRGGQASWDVLDGWALVTVDVNPLVLCLRYDGSDPESTNVFRVAEEQAKVAVTMVRRGSRELVDHMEREFLLMAAEEEEKKKLGYKGIQEYKMRFFRSIYRVIENTPVEAAVEEKVREIPTKKRILVQGIRMIVDNDADPKKGTVLFASKGNTPRFITTSRPGTPHLQVSPRRVNSRDFQDEEKKRRDIEVGATPYLSISTPNIDGHSPVPMLMTDSYSDHEFEEQLQDPDLGFLPSPTEKKHEGASVDSRTIVPPLPLYGDPVPDHPPQLKQSSLHSSSLSTISTTLHVHLGRSKEKSEKEKDEGSVVSIDASALTDSLASQVTSLTNSNSLETHSSELRRRADKNLRKGVSHVGVVSPGLAVRPINRKIKKIPDSGQLLTIPHLLQPAIKGRYVINKDPTEPKTRGNTFTPLKRSKSPLDGFMSKKMNIKKIDKSRDKLKNVDNLNNSLDFEYSDDLSLDSTVGIDGVEDFKNSKKARLMPLGLSREDSKLTTKEKFRQAFEREKSEKGIALSTTQEEDSLVTSYFDRNAKPIFVEHKNEEKSLVAQRFNKIKNLVKTGVFDRKFKREEGSEEVQYDDSIGGLSLEDQAAFDKMSEEEKKIFLQNMKRQSSQNLLLNLNGLENIEGSNTYMDQQKLVLKISLDDLKDTSISVLISSESDGKAFIILAAQSDENNSITDTPHVEESLTYNDIGEIPGLVKFESIFLKVPEKRPPSPEKTSKKGKGKSKPHKEQKQIAKRVVTFKNLKTNFKYLIYAVIDKTNQKQEDPSVMDITDEEPSAPTLTVHTPEENLELEWAALPTEEARRTELRAAIRSQMIQSAARDHIIAAPVPSDPGIPSPIYLPTDADIDFYMNKDGKALDEEETSSNWTDEKSVIAKNNVCGVRQWELFMEWWLDEKVNSDEEGFTKPRSEFLLQECLFAAQHKVFLHRYQELGFASSEEIEELKFFSTEAFIPGVIGKVRKDFFLDSPIFKKFRSFYKSGQIVRDYEEAEARKVRLAIYGKAELPPKDNLHQYEQTKEGNLMAPLSPMPSIQKPSPMMPAGFKKRTSGAGRSQFSGSQAELGLATKLTLRETILQERNSFLKTRIQEVNQCIQQMIQLFDGHKYSCEKKLRSSDLSFNRADLSAKDVASIMCSVKLLNLCLNNKIFNEGEGEDRLFQIAPTSFGPVPPYTHQIIGGCDIFRNVRPDILRPDEPPPVEMATLAGSHRRPIKPWQLCNQEEKTLELTLACSLDVIVEYAVKMGMAVPDPEDLLLTTGSLAARRKKRWQRFERWYAGEEFIEKAPGKGVPTLFRVVFAEEFESRYVDGDALVLQTMIENNIPIPKKYQPVVFEDGNSLDPSTEAKSTIEPTVLESFAEEDEEEEDSEAEEKSQDEKNEENTQKSTAEESNQERHTRLMNDPESLLQAYGTAVLTAAGRFLRVELLSRCVTVVLSRRRLGILRYMWPPASARTGRQFMFPRLGMITPKFELPAHRFKLFPSRRPDAYTQAEILAWYSDTHLDSDDLIMGKAEADGHRLRAYHEWLSKENERVADARQGMTDEDFIGHMRRVVTKVTEKTLDRNKQRLEVLGAEEEEDEEKELKDLLFTHSLPRDFWYVFEESRDFKYGSGIHNGDELLEMRELERERARKAAQEAAEFENYLAEEKKRRENEEQVRLKREEQNRRLVEGVARRRRLREHLDEVKRQRVLKAEEEKIRKRDEEERQKALVLEELRRRQELIAAREEEERRVEEGRLMAGEEAEGRELENRAREMQWMEHEDVMSYLNEQFEVHRRQEVEERLAVLEELYQPFEPFHFKNKRAILSSREDLLQSAGDSNTLDPVYSGVLNALSSHRAQYGLRLNEMDTQSSLSKRSHRYHALFEGEGRPLLAPTVTEEPELVSAGKTSALNTARTSVLSTARTEGSGMNLEKFQWLRNDPHMPEVRGAAHSPHKHHIRQEAFRASGANPYEADWNLQQSVTPACFVLTSREKPDRPFSGKELTERTLPKLEPILRPLQQPSSQGSEGGSPESFQIKKPKLSSQQSSGSVVSHTSSRSGSRGSTNQSTGKILRSLMQPPEPSPRLAPISQLNESTASKAKRGSVSTGSFLSSFPLQSVEKPAVPRLMREMSMAAILPLQRQDSLSLPSDQSSLPSKASLPSYFQPEDSIKELSKENTKELAEEGSLLEVVSEFGILDPSVDSGSRGKERLRGKSARKEMQKLLSHSQSAAAVASELKRTWPEPDQQKKLRFASYSSMMGAEERLKQKKIEAGVKAPRVQGEQVNKVKQELKELGIVDETLLDSRTRLLGKSAALTVEKMSKERELLQNYVSGQAILYDDFYLLACEPGVKNTTSLTTSAEVVEFAKQMNLRENMILSDGDNGKKLVEQLNLLAYNRKETKPEKVGKAPLTPEPAADIVKQYLTKDIFPSEDNQIDVSLKPSSSTKKPKQTQSKVSVKKSFNQAKEKSKQSWKKPKTNEISQEEPSKEGFLPPTLTGQTMSVGGTRPQVSVSRIKSQKIKIIPQYLTSEPITIEPTMNIKNLDGRQRKNSKTLNLEIRKPVYMENDSPLTKKGGKPTRSTGLVDHIDGDSLPDDQADQALGKGDDGLSFVDSIGDGPNESELQLASYLSTEV